jgi:hypothetical protein
MSRARAGHFVPIVIASLWACGPNYGVHHEEIAMSITSDPDDADKNRLATCAQRSIPEPWRVFRAQSFAKEFSLGIEARADDLGIAHRAYGAREQQFIEVTIGPFRSYTVINPDIFPDLRAANVLTALAEVDGVRADAFAPFQLYTSRTSVIAVDVIAGNYCVRRDTPADWPNPFLRCQLVRQPYSAAAVFSADALRDLPRIVARISALFDSLKPCLTSELNHDEDHS